MRALTITVGIAVALFFMTVFFGSWYTIDEGERGVILRNGAVVGVADPGLGFKLPVVDTVVPITVQSKARHYENVLTYSRDQQTATLTVSVNYRLPAEQVQRIYAEFGGEEGILNRLLDRQVFEEVKVVFGRYNAVSAIQDRERMVADMQMAVQRAVQGPIIIDSLQVENIDFSDAYEASIEQRMLAEVEVQKVKQNAEREKVSAEIAVIQAQAQADAALAQARAEAESIRIKGEAEAAAIAARGAAIRENPGLVELTTAERWNGQLPATMVPGSAVPFLGVR
jgi:regulator of protease activity HflC (stomatin/prohibitin superfamily)